MMDSAPVTTAPAVRAVFLCDGGATIGFGHVSRCLSLAEAFEEQGWRPLFAGRLADGADDLVASAGFPSEARTLRTGEEDAPLTAAWCAAQGTAVVVVDSYALPPGYVRALARGLPVLLLDDYGRLPSDDYAACAAVVHPSIVAEPDACPGAAAVLSGPGYLPLRRALRRQRQAHPRPIGAVRRVLVTLGGGDPRNQTLRVVAALSRVAPDVEVQAVVGRGSPWREELTRALAACGAGSRLLGPLPTLAEALAAADVCVCGGGMTKFEAAYLGVPAVAIPVNVDQEPESRLFDRLGVLRDLGPVDRLTDAALAAGLDGFLRDAALRAAMSVRARGVFPEDPTRAVVDFVGTELGVMDRSVVSHHAQETGGSCHAS